MKKLHRLMEQTPNPLLVDHDRRWGATITEGAILAWEKAEDDLRQLYVDAHPRRLCRAS